MIHWLNTELWGPIWPNTVAPSVWTLLAVGLSHWRTRKRLRRHEEKLDKVTKGLK